MQPSANRQPIHVAVYMRDGAETDEEVSSEKYGKLIRSLTADMGGGIFNEARDMTPMVDAFVENGFNAMAVSYGTAKADKTAAMWGRVQAATEMQPPRKLESGLIHQTLEKIFTRANAMPNQDDEGKQISYAFGVSLLCVRFNSSKEQLIDCLNGNETGLINHSTSASTSQVQQLETRDGSIVLKHLTRKRVLSDTHAMRILDNARMRHKKMNGTTDCHWVAILTLDRHVQSMEMVEENGEKQERLVESIRRAQFQFADLAPVPTTFTRAEVASEDGNAPDTIVVPLSGGAKKAHRHDHSISLSLNWLGDVVASAATIHPAATPSGSPSRSPQASPRRATIAPSSGRFSAPSSAHKHYFRQSKLTRLLKAGLGSMRSRTHSLFLLCFQPPPPAYTGDFTVDAQRAEHDTKLKGWMKATERAVEFGRNLANISNIMMPGSWIGEEIKASEAMHHVPIEKDQPRLPRSGSARRMSIRQSPSSRAAISRLATPRRSAMSGSSLNSAVRPTPVKRALTYGPPTTTENDDQEDDQENHPPPLFAGIDFTLHGIASLSSTDKEVNKSSTEEENAHQAALPSAQRVPKHLPDRLDPIITQFNNDDQPGSQMSDKENAGAQTPSTPNHCHTPSCRTPSSRSRSRSGRKIPGSASTHAWLLHGSTMHHDAFVESEGEGAVTLEPMSIDANMDNDAATISQTAADSTPPMLRSASRLRPASSFRPPQAAVPLPAGVHVPDTTACLPQSSSFSRSDSSNRIASVQQLQMQQKEMLQSLQAVTAELERRVKPMKKQQSPSVNEHSTLLALMPTVERLHDEMRDLNATCKTAADCARLQEELRAVRDQLNLTERACSSASGDVECEEGGGKEAQRSKTAENSANTDAHNASATDEGMDNETVIDAMEGVPQVEVDRSSTVDVDSTNITEPSTPMSRSNNAATGTGAKDSSSTCSRVTGRMRRGLSAIFCCRNDDALPTPKRQQRSQSDHASITNTEAPQTTEYGTATSSSISSRRKSGTPATNGNAPASSLSAPLLTEEMTTAVPSHENQDSATGNQGGCTIM